jgi:hypothetical protein
MDLSASRKIIAVTSAVEKLNFSEVLEALKRPELEN